MASAWEKIHQRRVACSTQIGAKSPRPPARGCGPLAGGGACPGVAPAQTAACCSRPGRGQQTSHPSLFLTACLLLANDERSLRVTDQQRFATELPIEIRMLHPSRTHTRSKSVRSPRPSPPGTSPPAGPAELQRSERLLTTYSYSILRHFLSHCPYVLPPSVPRSLFRRRGGLLLYLLPCWPVCRPPRSLVSRCGT